MFSILSIYATIIGLIWVYVETPTTTYYTFDMVNAYTSTHNKWFSHWNC